MDALYFRAKPFKRSAKIIEVGNLVRRRHGKDQVMFVLSIELDKKEADKDKIICTWVNKRGVEKQKEFKRKDLELVVV